METDKMNQINTSFYTTTYNKQSVQINLTNLIFVQYYGSFHL